MRVDRISEVSSWFSVCSPFWMVLDGLGVESQVQTLQAAFSRHPAEFWSLTCPGASPCLDLWEVMRSLLNLAQLLPPCPSPPVYWGFEITCVVSPWPALN